MANQPYRGVVGALAWLVLGTRPDIAFATSSLAPFGHDLGRVYWDAAKRVLRYLKGTKQWRLVLGGKPPEIAAFTDADWEVIVTLNRRVYHQQKRSTTSLDFRTTMVCVVGWVVDVEGFRCEC